MTDSKAYKKLTPRQVAEHYLQTELTNLIEGDFELKSLSEKQLMRALEALSFTYRANRVFHFVSDESYDWTEEFINAEEVTLTGMSFSVTKLIYSKQVNQDPIKLRDFLIDYFKKHPNDDPLKLNELRPTGRQVSGPVMLRESGGKLYMLDGSHRLVEQLLAGATRVKAYCARPNNKAGKPMLGDAHILTLRILYGKSKTVAESQAIIDAAKLAVEHSKDAAQAVQDYWVNSNKPHFKEAGRKILSS